MANEMIAKIELLGCLTHHARGRNFRKNKPQILTNAADIQYYQSQSIFSVTFLSAERKKVTMQTVPINNDLGADDDDDDVGEENDDDNGAEFRYDDDDDDDDDDDGDDDDKNDDGEEDDGADTARYTLKDLVGYKKDALKEIVRKLGLSDSGTVDELKSRIVKATKR
jgi:hypothetical protein